MRAAARPVAAPDDDGVVASACEARAFRIARGVRLRDRFFAKGQPYSLLDLLAHDALAPRFAGGTVYQAFLSPLSYHRWHAPVAGTVRRAVVRDGTYFSEPRPGSGGGGGIMGAQAYLTAVAARAVVFLDADNGAVGLVAFVAIGMGEVSSCDVSVREGQRVAKGDELGMFHYGGSSHCLVFGAGVGLDGLPALGRDVNVPVRGRLAVVRPVAARGGAAVAEGASCGVGKTIPDCL